jgi:hypothetical protein
MVKTEKYSYQSNMNKEIDRKLVYSYILDIANMYNLRSEVHEFPSGAIMIDVWKSKDLFVTQLYDNIIGFSVVNEENLDFSTVPNETFPDFDSFKENFDRELKIGSI